jgi:hypothetical protein
VFPSTSFYLYTLTVTSISLKKLSVDLLSEQSWWQLILGRIFLYCFLLWRQYQHRITLKKPLDNVNSICKHIICKPWLSNIKIPVTYFSCHKAFFPCFAD